MKGTTFLGQKTVQTNGEGRVAFAFDAAVNTGGLVTATATILAGDPLRPGNTSECSVRRTVKTVP
jgi:hypothetical protein